MNPENPNNKQQPNINPNPQVINPNPAPGVPVQNSEAPQTEDTTAPQAANTAQQVDPATINPTQQSNPNPTLGVVSPNSTANQSVQPSQNPQSPQGQGVISPEPGINNQQSNPNPVPQVANSSPSPNPSLQQQIPQNQNIASPQTADAANLQPEKKKNPPIAAQILYALGFLAMIGGLYASYLYFRLASDSGAAGAVFSSRELMIRSVLFALLTVGGFAIINFIRALKKWALTTYTALIGIGFVYEVYRFTSFSEIERAFIGYSVVREFLPYVIVGSLLAVLWTKNKKEFS